MPCAKTAICLIALGLISVVSSLRAEVQTNPKCAEHGKGRAFIIACSCALEIGGHVLPDGRFVIGSQGAAEGARWSHQFDECVKRWPRRE